MRMFQGHSTHCQNITLFTDFYLLQKGVGRWLSIPNSVDWLKFNNFGFNYGLMDREFYRVQLVKMLKDRKIPIIMPAKKYSHVKRRIKNYLLKTAPLVSTYLFKQKPGAKPWQSSVNLHIVIVGHDDQPAWKIRDQFWKKQITYDEAIHHLSAFFTTLDPWKNKRSWAKWLTKTYKIRWNQETGFSSLNRIHEQFRYRYPTVHLAELYLRAMIHNGWQFYRNQGLKQGIHHQELTLFWYRNRMLNQLEEIIVRSSYENVKYLQKRKRRLYFEI
ncbi:transposase [Candidatus Lokiarchaeum ossiferum]|uniref:transposase n=1 Tax=Candidatus Lokiarchaeum ossiferum TaxID=2951803 RepID=UPI00352E0CA2